MPTALIYGINGQDGSYLAELLLTKGYRLYGWMYGPPDPNEENIRHLNGQFEWLAGDFLDATFHLRCIETAQPDEVYNLAAPSFPASSWEHAAEVGWGAGLAVAHILDAIHLVRSQARFYQASTSELFGVPLVSPQNETTPFAPRNPYGVAKLYAHWLTANYRQQHSLHAVCGILYNHESPRRGRQYVTRKISHAAAAIKLGLESELRLGDLDARRDWGWAPDYVRAMWAMLRTDGPEDLVLGTGETHSVTEFCQLAFACLDLDYQDYVVVDPALVRPPESVQLVADPRRARHKLDWDGQLPFSEIVQRMVQADLGRLTSS